MSEVQPSNITINSNSGSSQGGSFFDNILNNVFKWGILLIGVLIIIGFGFAIYIFFFSDIIDTGFNVIDGLSLAIPPLGAIFTVGGLLGRLFG